MGSKRALERRLAELSGFESPRQELEQYPTPADLAATLVHLADLRGDLERPVIDLGAGAGVLAIGAAIRAAPQVVGIERDHRALHDAIRNEATTDPPTTVDWLLADATRPPLALPAGTVLMNPPFGAQRGHEHADRAFLRSVSDLATVSYSIHNEDSWSFVEAFATDNGGQVTNAYQTRMTLDRQFAFHDHERTEIGVELFRIEWS